MGIALTYRAKGIDGLVARAGTILKRFSITQTRVEKYLTFYSELTAAFDVQPTLPITATVLARHPALIAHFAERGMEFAIHGLVHEDHASLGFEIQRSSIGQALAIFQAANIPCTGFRGPYLRYNDATQAAVRSLGLRYHCSQAVDFAAIEEEDEHSATAGKYRRALNLYRALNADKIVVRPRNCHGLINMPVAIPDDEIMVDRLHFDSHSQTLTWLAILEQTYERGELFTLQLHPERIFECAGALQAVLTEAQQFRPRIWIARLDDIAAWWLRRGRAILEVQTCDDRHRIRLEGDHEATLLVRGLPAVDATPWHGPDLVARERSFEVRASRKPVVGISTRSPRRVLGFLREEGLPTEISDERDKFGAYVDVADGAFDEVNLLAQIECSPGPLVRLARWPGAARSALAVTGDIDSITLQDFVFRLWETRGRTPAPKSQEVNDPAWGCEQ